MCRIVGRGGLHALAQGVSARRSSPPRPWFVCCVCVSAGPSRAGDDGAQFLLFSGADLWRDGRFLYDGFLWSAGRASIDEGFTLKALVSGGRYRYISGALANATVTGTEGEIQLLPGWRFKRRPARGSRSLPGSTSSKTPPVADDPSQPLARDERRRARRGQSVVRADALHHAGRGRVAHLDRHRLFGAPRLWLAAQRLVLSRPRGAGLRLRRLQPAALRRPCDRVENRPMGMVGGGRLVRSTATGAPGPICGSGVLTRR